ncbi:MAG: YitT family protein [Acidobacteria bacterium]|nr:YitT family protein [Acidobacteriota bacterium]
MLKKVLRGFWRGFLLVAGTLLFALAVRGLFIPNHLLTGGVTGAALLLHTLFAWPVGLTVLLLNVPIFLLGARDVGKVFALGSGAGVVLFWLLADYVPAQPLTHDPMLAGIFGGLLSGLGGAIALRSGASLGGFDILGVVLNRRFSLGVGEAGLFLNGAIILAAGLLENAEMAMYTLIGIYVASKAMDAIQAPRPRKAVLIISTRSKEIRDKILFKMGRGLTVLKAEGAYEGAMREALLCVITRFELRELRDLIREEDPEAFVTVLEASDVIGRFKKPTAYAIWQKLRIGGAPPEIPRPS